MPSLLVSFAANEDRPRGFLIPLSSASQLVGLTPGLGVKLGTLGCGPECSTLGGGSSELQNSLTLPTFPPAFLGLGLGFFFFFFFEWKEVSRQIWDLGTHENSRKFTASKCIDPPEFSRWKCFLGVCFPT